MNYVLKMKDGGGADRYLSSITEDNKKDVRVTTTSKVEDALLFEHFGDAERYRQKGHLMGRYHVVSFTGDAIKALRMLRG